jgi:hypothetical protein
MTKPREIRWVGLAAGIAKTKYSCRALVRKRDENIWKTNTYM